MASADSPEHPSTAPVPLRIAAAVAAVEGIALVALMVAELAHLHSTRIEMGTSTAFFFGAYGLGLLACAYGLLTLRSWSRGPVLFAQFVQLGLAWNFRDGMLWLSALLAGLAVVALVSLVQRDSIEALERRTTT